MKRLAIAAVGVALVALAACGRGEQETTVSDRGGGATPTAIPAPTPTQVMPATYAPTPQAYTVGIHVVRPDGSGLRRLGGWGVDQHSWSPDGKRIAFVVGCAFNTVFVDEPDSESTRGPATVGGYAHVKWEPDGQRLLIWSVEDDGSTHVLSVNAADLAEPRELFDGSLVQELQGFEWSPDGTRIAYVDSGEVKLLNVADGQTTTIAGDVASDILVAPIRWAPDGRHLAYVDAANDVVVIGADGSDRLVVASPGLDPEWMPDGQRLIFYRPAEDDPRKRESVAIVPAVGGPVEELTNGHIFDVSSDGNLVAVHKQHEGRWEIEVFDLAAGGSRVVSGQVEASVHLSFSPDGAQLLFASSDLDRGLYLVNVDGTGLRPLVQRAGGYIREPKWSSDGRFVSFDVTSGGGCAGP